MVQPIGIYPFPANFLVVDDSFCTPDEQALLLSGGLPSEGSLFRLALDGDLDGALALLGSGTPAAKFDRFLLRPSEEDYQTLKGELGGELRAMLDVAAYTMNLTSEPLAIGDVDEEFKAMVLSARATYDLECGETESALARLREARDAAAAVSPVFAAQLAGTLAETKHQASGASAEVAALYKQAIDGLRNTALEASAATLNLNLGVCYQELSQGSRGALLEAVKHYQEALRYFTRENFPEEFAFTQNNLALAYLSIPLTEASDALRVAIAVQALREALKVYQKETHPELWASTKLNLANALQYAPSGHVEENLRESVGIYEEILEVRQPTQNPAGYARLLANQGNALAHLGVFDHAKAKLTEARAIFAQIGEEDSAAAIDEVLGEIGESQDLKIEESQNLRKGA